MSIAFLPFEVPKSYPQYPLLSLAEDEGLSHFGELLSFSGSLPCVQVIYLFDFLLLILLFVV